MGQHVWGEDPNVVFSWESELLVLRATVLELLFQADGLGLIQTRKHYTWVCVLGVMGIVRSSRLDQRIGFHSFMGAYR